MRNKIKKIIFFIIFPTIILIAGIECLTFVYRRHFSIDKKTYNYLCHEVKKPFFKVEEENSLGKRIVPNRSEGNKFSFLMPKPSNKKRIFIVGESVAMLLRDRFPSLEAVTENLEIINCGMGAYDSSRILDVFMEVMEYEPDMVIVLSGNNECKGLEYVCLKSAIPYFLSMKVDQYFFQKKEENSFMDIEIQKERLRKMAQAAASKNVSMVLCTLPVNMSGFPPVGHLPFYIRNFSQGFFLMENRDFENAEKKFRTVLAKNPKEALAHFYLAKTLEKLGKFKEAKKHYQLAIEWDVLAQRTTAARNEMIRKVAKEEGICLADLEKSFMDGSDYGIINGDYIMDGVHWFEEYNDFVFSEILRYAGNFEFTDGLFKKDKLDLLKEVKISPIEKSGNDKVFVVLRCAMAHINKNCSKGHEISEISLMMIDKAYKMDMELVSSALSSRGDLKKFLKDCMWTTPLAGTLDKWLPNLYHHLAEFFRRDKKFNKAGEFIEKALRLRPEESSFCITKELISAESEKKPFLMDDFTRIVMKGN